MDIIEICTGAQLLVIWRRNWLDRLASTSLKKFSVIFFFFKWKGEKVRLIHLLSYNCHASVDFVLASPFKRAVLGESQALKSGLGGGIHVN